MSALPILYSFRRCPYAMRARLAIYSSNIKCELREVVLRDKPSEMLEISPKATVPVLQLIDGTVIDESHDIAIWAIKQNDPNGWDTYIEEMSALVQMNDFRFKTHLDKYKYSSRNPELSMEEHRENANFFLEHLETLLEKNRFLSSERQTITDLAVFPFIRQFAFVDKTYFYALKFKRLQSLLDYHIESIMFKNIMIKYNQWQPGTEPVYFP